jgi:hypothetical protein
VAELSARQVAALAAVVGALVSGAVAGGGATLAAKRRKPGGNHRSRRTDPASVRERQKETAMRHRTHLPRLDGIRGAPAIRSLGLVALVAAAALALAACGGSSGPHVARLPASNAGASTTDAGPSSTTAATGESSSATRPAKGNSTALVDEWATCMQSHGDPNQAAPTIDAHGVINVTTPGSGQPSIELSNAVHAGTDPCNPYMAAAKAALRAANPVAPPPDQAELIKYTDCMRANGVPNYPYPAANMTFQGTGVDPNSPAVMRVNNLCGRKLDLPAWWVAGTGPPGDVTVGNGVSPGNPPPCFYAKTGCPKRQAPVAGGNGAGGATPVQPGG